MPDPSRHTFRKAERLCSKKRIEELFSNGRSLSAYPLRAIYEVHDQDLAPVQVLISVSKRHFKHAVDRNRLKRCIREAYRLNKHILLQHTDGHKLSLAFIWMSDEMADFATIEAKAQNLLQRIAEYLPPETQLITES